jgi:pantothenate kinase type III
VVATGGLSPRIAPLCETVTDVDPDLTLKGLLSIHAKNA